MIDLEQLLTRRRIAPSDWISNLCSENQLNSMEDFKNWEKNNTQYKIGETLKLAAEEFFQANIEDKKEMTKKAFSEMVKEIGDPGTGLLVGFSSSGTVETEDKDNKSAESQIHSSKKRKSKPVEEESES